MIDIGTLKIGDIIAYTIPGGLGRYYGLVVPEQEFISRAERFDKIVVHGTDLVFYRDIYGRYTSIAADLFHRWDGRVVDVDKERVAIEKAKAREVLGIRAHVRDRIKDAEREAECRLSELSRLENLLQPSS